MRKRTREPSRWRIAAVLSLLGAAQALAQQGSVVNLEKEVEVTATRIARIDGEGGLPVQVITREELLDGGVQTTQDLLGPVSANIARMHYGAVQYAFG